MQIGAALPVFCKCCAIPESRHISAGQALQLQPTAVFEGFTQDLSQGYVHTVPRSSPALCMRFTHSLRERTDTGNQNDFRLECNFLSITAQI